jgi:putative transcriptional regulator
MELKNRVRELRMQEGLTQEALGAAVEVSRQTINSIERYKYKPTIELALRLAQRLNCSVEHLFYFTE